MRLSLSREVGDAATNPKTPPRPACCLKELSGLMQRVTIYQTAHLYTSTKPREIWTGEVPLAPIDHEPHAVMDSEDLPKTGHR